MHHRSRNTLSDEAMLHPKINLISKSVLLGALWYRIGFNLTVKWSVCRYHEMMQPQTAMLFKKTALKRIVRAVAEEEALALEAEPTPKVQRTLSTEQAINVPASPRICSQCSSRYSLTSLPNYYIYVIFFSLIVYFGFYDYLFCMLVLQMLRELWTTLQYQNSAML
ncbi:hypothetical protein MA16_Dca014142 [Dendrobium catenatum]|uniref:Uncharacterized protein n=1 Tax=Dendrobium catenatum TaxID=906689 RepID=A0A2I0VTJ4_9ASPA|nr:hypothetical protein MA16_Dca014142 [Dendrobium catenatum]